MKDERVIGIVGGVGPFAGLDLQCKILEETVASKDQEHLTVLAISRPAPIPDRTEYLLGQVSVNPAGPLAAQLLALERAGAQVAAIPCNTAHAPPIFDEITDMLLRTGSRLQLLHMMRETAAFLRTHWPQVQRVGVLSTTGTYRAGVYPLVLEPAGFQMLAPTEAMQTEFIHPAIYDPVYGIKACGVTTERARDQLLRGATALAQAGAEAIVLGCTEIPLALPQTELDGVLLVDATRVLARALVRAAAPGKLRPHGTVAV